MEEIFKTRIGKLMYNNQALRASFSAKDQIQIDGVIHIELVLCTLTATIYNIHHVKQTSNLQICWRIFY